MSYVKEYIEETRKVLPEGQYVLTQDVENPSADRRHKRSVEYMVTWTAGMKFDVMVNTFNHGDINVKYNTVKGTGVFGQVGSSHDGFEALVAALVPVEVSTESMAHQMRKRYVSNDTILETLVEVYCWKPEAVEDFVAVVCAREDDKA